MRYTICLVLVSACAAQSPQPQPGYPDRPMVASLQPMVGASEASPQMNPAAAAGALLEQGLVHFRDSQYGLAVKAFQFAIETGRLNDAGRALAYWHVFAAAHELGDIDASADALAAFVVVAEDVLEIRDETRYAVSNAGDFVERFNVVAKLQTARAMLAAAWATRAPHFGRTADQAIPVEDDAELDKVLDIIAPCESAERDDRAQRQVADTTGYYVQRVTLTCGGPGASIEFYFDVRTLDEELP
jgi:hypothetical protein